MKCTLTTRFPHAIWVTLLSCLLLAACSSSPGIQHEIAPTTDTRQTVAALALAQLGAGYREDAAGPDAFDSSGLAYFAYRGAGASLPRSIDGQLNAGKPVPLSAAKPADLIFFRVETTGGDSQLRIGLYTRAGQMLMAQPCISHQSGVRLVNLDGDYWQQRLVGVVRVLP